MPEIKVNLPNEPYSIVIESGVLSQLGECVSHAAPHARCLLAMDSNVVQPHGEIARQSLERAGYEAVPVTLIAEEKHKTLAAAESLYRVMLDARLERRSPVIALGGGIVGDIAGYAAATYLRGVPLIHVPTTLLAMVDASIGGKTGVNFPLPGSDDLGKNLIGAFWQPKLVLADPHTLTTLRDRDFQCGLAECVKHGLIADKALLLSLCNNPGRLLARDMDSLTPLIAASAAIKARIVAEDEREHGTRMLLNLGHTFAHALESISALGLLHGEAVSIGINAALVVARSLNRISDVDHQVAAETIFGLGLPFRIASPAPREARVEAGGVEAEREWFLAHGVTIDRLIGAMTFDKKVADGKMRLVLPRGIGAADVVDDVPLALVREAWLQIGAAE